MFAIRQIPRVMLTLLRAVSTKRVLTLAAAVLLTVSAAAFPASRPAPSENTGERFGAVHWYIEAERRIKPISHYAESS